MTSSLESTQVPEPKLERPWPQAAEIGKACIQDDTVITRVVSQCAERSLRIT